ncbi:MAG: hypothetical protein V4577_15825 [Bacteroidota bacterium]
MIVKKRPKPNPELHKLDRLVGIWNVSGEVCGQVSYSWMEGGFFLVQYVDIEGEKGLEFIGYDEDSGALKSHYFDGDGKVLEYNYDITDTDHIITIDMPHIQGSFHGKYSNNGNTISGRWYWKQGDEEMGYRAIFNRLNLS